ncbi:MAG: adenylyltransferase/cytidyltransferase family protein [Simkania sp.]|nr:adenylyltransferase/cytidyltransferase family protein [Simkania sp.]
MKVDDILQYKTKVKTVDELTALLPPRPRQKKVILCHGVFDVVHPGHVRHLLYAKSKGDTLIVSITADEHITKGNVRPHVPEQLRAINLAAFEMVDYVIIDRESTPLKNLAALQPDYFAKGYEYVGNGTHPKTLEEITVLESYGGEVIFTPGDIVYSSSQFIEMSPPRIGEDKLVILMDIEGLNFNDLREAIKSFAGIKIHVVGDSIVDSYTQCSMIGGMTKTPTMSLRYEKKQDFTGGAAIVAKHLKAAGADVVFSTVLGDDVYRDHILSDLKNCNVHCLPIIDSLRPTTNKNAFVVGDYRVLKIDTLDNRSISEKILKELTTQISQTSSDGIVFSDFRHGIFNRKTIPTLISAIPANTYRVADSQVASRWGNILDFKGFDLITPNEKEARFSLADQDSVIRFLGADLFKQSEASTLFLKLGDRGLIVFRNRPGTPTVSFFVDSFAERAVDPVGAGDALLAYSTLAMIQTKHEAIAAILGSFAASIECEHNGNVPVTPKDLLDRIDRIERRIRYEG